MEEIPSRMSSFLIRDATLYSMFILPVKFLLGDGVNGTTFYHRFPTNYWKNGQRGKF